MSRWLFAAAVVLAAAGCSDDETSSPTEPVATADSTDAPSPATEPPTTPPSSTEPSGPPPSSTGPSSTQSPATERPGGPAPVASVGCGSSDAGALRAERRYLRSDGIRRSYVLAVPPEHDGDTPLPVVFDFHGFSEGSEVHTLMSAMPDYAVEHGFVAVLPEGTQDPVRWDTTPDEERNPDLRFVERMLDQFERELCIDTSRLYATGLSNGAFMASSIACTLSHRFAAVAPVAGANVLCDRLDRPVPVYAIHGTADGILLFNGGVSLENVPGADPTPGESPDTTLPKAELDGTGYPANMERWAERNGCEPGYEDRKTARDVIERTWDCPDGADVVFMIVVGGGHSWPGSDFSAQVESVIGPTTMNLDATDAMWRFFQRFALRAR